MSSMSNNNYLWAVLVREFAVLPSIAYRPMAPRPAPGGVESIAITRPRDASPQWALDVLVDSGLAAFLVLDGPRITYVSPAFLMLIGWETSKAIRPAGLPELIGDADCARFLAGLASAGGRHRDIRTLRRLTDSEAYLAIDAAVIQTTTGPRTVLVASDVTTWMQSQARLQRLAFEDTLTGLANRALLHDRMAQAIAAARRNAGDLVLRETARRLQAAARAVDTVARLGGDEFVVLLGGDGGRDEAQLVVQRIMQAVTAPLAVHELRLGVSVGIAIYPDDGSNAEQLLARADGAMYDAKDRGGNRHAFAEGTGFSARICMRLAWSPTYMIGIEAVDKQHEELVTKMNSLWEALL